MALRIRLARGGTKKRPHYNIVISDSRSPARRPLHREDRLLQSAAAVGSCRPPQARSRQGQGLDRQGRGGVRPRAQIARQCRPGEGARCTTIRRRPSPRRRRRSAPPPRPRPPRRSAGVLSGRGPIGARRPSRRRHRRAGTEGRGEGEALHRNARSACRAMARCTDAHGTQIRDHRLSSRQSRARR